MGKMEVLDKIEKVVYVTQPSPIVLVSTISKDNILNVAPFGMFMNCSTKPYHMIAIAISPKTDTYANIKETKQFIVGIPQENMLQKLCKAGEKVDSNINEFEYANLTPYDSKELQCKRIRECIVNIDCTYEKEIETGNHNIIVGKVIGCDIDEDRYSEDKVKLRCNIPNIYHITGNKFMVNGALKEINEENKMDIYSDIYNRNKVLIDIAIEKLKKCDNDPMHCFGHTLDVINYTKELLEKISANKEVCIIAAYWHDVGREIVDKGHAQESGKMLKEEMEKLGYDEDMIQQCYLAVINHNRNSNPTTIEGKIIRDADKIAYIGKNRWEKCIKQDYRLLNKIIEEDLPILKDEVLRLDVSKELFERDMNEYIKDYLKIIETKRNKI